MIHENMVWLEWLRLVNVILCIGIAGGLLLDRASPWRRVNSTWRLTFTCIAATYVWLSWGSLEAHILDVPSNGSRIWGFTLILLLTITALIIQSRRSRREDKAYGRAPGPGGNYREPIERQQHHDPT